MHRIYTRFNLLLCSILLASCAATGGGADGSDPWADAGPLPAADRQGSSASEARGPNKEPGPPPVIAAPSGKVDWVAVFESPPGARYNEQRVIYVDRSSVAPQPLEKLTYYLARTREVSRSGAKPKVQEIAVLCEGDPIAPATSLRGEGTEEAGGNYSIRRAALPLTSVSQFSTQRLRPDASNPNTFIVRAVCMLGTGG